MHSTEKKNPKKVKSTFKKVIRKEIEEKSVTLRAEEPKVRYLKLKPFYYALNPNERIVPELRLCGKWFEQAGFLPENYVSVTIMDGLLVIRSAEPKETDLDK